MRTDCSWNLPATAWLPVHLIDVDQAPVAPNLFLIACCHPWLPTALQPWADPLDNPTALVTNYRVSATPFVAR